MVALHHKKTDSLKSFASIIRAIRWMGTEEELDASGLGASGS